MLSVSTISAPRLASAVTANNRAVARYALRYPVVGRAWQEYAAFMEKVDLELLSYQDCFRCFIDWMRAMDPIALVDAAKYTHLFTFIPKMPNMNLGPLEQAQINDHVPAQAVQSQDVLVPLLQDQICHVQAASDGGVMSLKVSDDTIPLKVDDGTTPLKFDLEREQDTVASRITSSEVAQGQTRSFSALDSTEGHVTPQLQDLDLPVLGGQSGCDSTGPVLVGVSHVRSPEENTPIFARPILGAVGACDMDNEATIEIKDVHVSLELPRPVPTPPDSVVAAPAWEPTTIALACEPMAAALVHEPAEASLAGDMDDGCSTVEAGGSPSAKDSGTDKHMGSTHTSNTTQGTQPNEQGCTATRVTGSAPPLSLPDSICHQIETLAAKMHSSSERGKSPSTRPSTNQVKDQHVHRLVSPATDRGSLMGGDTNEGSRTVLKATKLSKEYFPLPFPAFIDIVSLPAGKARRSKKRLRKLLIRRWVVEKRWQAIQAVLPAEQHDQSMPQIPGCDSAVPQVIRLATSAAITGLDHWEGEGCAKENVARSEVAMQLMQVGDPQQLQFAVNEQAAGTMRTQEKSRVVDAAATQAPGSRPPNTLQALAPDIVVVGCAGLDDARPIAAACLIRAPGKTGTQGAIGAVDTPMCGRPPNNSQVLAPDKGVVVDTQAHDKVQTRIGSAAHDEQQHDSWPQLAPDPADSSTTCSIGYFGIKASQVGRNQSIQDTSLDDITRLIGQASRIKPEHGIDTLHMAKAQVDGSAVKSETNHDHALLFRTVSPLRSLYGRGLCAGLQYFSSKGLLLGRFRNHSRRELFDSSVLAHDSHNGRVGSDLQHSSAHGFDTCLAKPASDGRRLHKTAVKMVNTQLKNLPWTPPAGAMQALDPCLVGCGSVRKVAPHVRNMSVVISSVSLQTRTQEWLPPRYMHVHKRIQGIRCAVFSARSMPRSIANDTTWWRATFLFQAPACETRRIKPSCASNGEGDDVTILDRNHPKGGH
ncbi:hypothetical protein BCR44DRAFT_43246 [Catenaria anguillulae PL171]|uniref:Uncharacterized protein n=1 Tax=Catenaria anguillulae PL171 TaxID=765915 RepID=A0A1Y2H3V0_9FUNG|nr:hypothetical protein BCR44DRAFT_43246 [Catenaria anguillulae PL171]